MICSSCKLDGDIFSLFSHGGAIGSAARPPPTTWWVQGYYYCASISGVDGKWISGCRVGIYRVVVATDILWHRLLSM